MKKQSVSRSSERVIQDLGVPLHRTEEFVERLVAGKHAQLPFWLCPSRFEGLAHEASLFPPPRGQRPRGGGWIMDVATFGQVPRSALAPNDKYFHNRCIDAILDDVGGAKTFYSDVLYSPKYIHEHFNGTEYERLKKKYDPTNRFPHLHGKVINRG